CDRVLVRFVWPARRHVLVGLEAEQVRGGGDYPLAGALPDLLGGVRGAPAAVLEAALAILVGTAEALHDPVEGQELHYRQPSHLVAPLGGRYGTRPYSTTEISRPSTDPDSRGRAGRPAARRATRPPARTSRICSNSATS